MKPFKQLALALAATLSLAAHADINVGVTLSATGPAEVKAGDMTIQSGKKISATVSRTPVESCIDVVAAGRMKLIITLFSA